MITIFIFCGGGCCLYTRSVPLVFNSAKSPKTDHCKINLCMCDVQAIKVLSNSVHISFFRVLAECGGLFLKLAGREHDRVWMYRGDTF